MIALITPTGARQVQTLLCARFMHRQTYTGPVLWVIVDDCKPQTTDFIRPDFREGWQIVKAYPKPVWEPGQNTQGRNIAAGMEIVKQYGKAIEAIFIIEDDDYYRPVYLEEMMFRFAGYDLIGETRTVYYNLRTRKYVVNGNDRWSSLFQTAFRPSVIPIFEQLYGEKFIDFELFRQVKLSKINLFQTDNYLSIGMKGQPGRAGIGAGHGNNPNMIPDTNAEQLKSFIGTDFELYADYFSFDGCI